MFNPNIRNILVPVAATAVLLGSAACGSEAPPVSLPPDCTEVEVVQKDGLKVEVTQKALHIPPGAVIEYSFDYGDIGDDNQFDTENKPTDDHTYKKPDTYVFNAGFMELDKPDSYVGCDPVEFTVVANPTAPRVTTTTR